MENKRKLEERLKVATYCRVGRKEQLDNNNKKSQNSKVRNEIEESD